MKPVQRGNIRRVQKYLELARDGGLSTPVQSGAIRATVTVPSSRVFISANIVHVSDANAGLGIVNGSATSGFSVYAGTKFKRGNVNLSRLDGAYGGAVTLAPDGWEGSTGADFLLFLCYFDASPVGRGAGRWYLVATMEPDMEIPQDEWDSMVAAFEVYGDNLQTLYIS